MVHTILTHGTASTSTGKLLRASFEQAYIKIGTGTTIFQEDFMTFQDTITQSYIKAIWKFTDKYGIALRCNSAALPQLQRCNDDFLMAIVRQ